VKDCLPESENKTCRVLSRGCVGRAGRRNASDSAARRSDES